MRQNKLLAVGFDVPGSQHAAKRCAENSNHIISIYVAAIRIQDSAILNPSFSIRHQRLSFLKTQLLVPVRTVIALGSEANHALPVCGHLDFNDRPRSRQRSKIDEKLDVPCWRSDMIGNNLLTRRSTLS